ncbi:MAG: hypothetical protein A2087_14575 [Spirochaetes bacterium GWD1_61_31]|nr:MAG: hypothetical protein A2Y37_02200 [Spirochaetes bacterium GWB1_60_80]OHD35028.1 MAG: hypothetical protein A2004_00810 [Spirochaetes bacterium GWC1_61_12]OHD36570.1 MAG: hypothetical protein A2087_14575 [Spirochaetes bacterium GWD1_61_31]OHD41739.1 MAG: hypothetical protein A2Y35_09070 [Spirochaetes bacterium GWE1_60_18]OHD61598.1 MAG: hypothetical protein A2Y32_01380 [Spirochaetes bacterium GWF1_60_12]HAP44041.1 hypothetical protein [Spirochaetaceae bacterium]
MKLTATLLLGATALALVLGLLTTCAWPLNFASGSITVNLRQPEAAVPSERGLAALAAELLGQGLSGARIIAPGTTSVKLVCSAPDMSTKETTATFNAGAALSLTLSGIPTGSDRTITVTAYDAADSVLTSGSVIMDIVAGSNAASLGLVPVAPQSFAPGPTGLGDLAVSGGLTAYCKVELALAGTYCLFLADQDLMYLLATELLLYDAEGRSLAGAVDVDVDSPYYGRLTVAAPTILYLGLRAPAGTDRTYAVSLDADWRPALVNGYMPAPLLETPYVDARGPILLDFPNTLPAAAESREINSLVLVSPDSTVSGRRMTVLNPGIWPFGSVSDLVLTITDPLVGGTRQVALPAVDLRYFYWVEPNGPGLEHLRSAPGGLELAMEARNGMNPGDQPVIMLAEGNYSLTGGLVISNTTHLFGGWDGAASGSIVTHPVDHNTVLDSPGAAAVLSIQNSPNDSRLHGLAIKPQPENNEMTYSLSVTTGAAPVIWNCLIYARSNAMANGASYAISCDAGTAPVFAACGINAPQEDGYAQVGVDDSAASAYAVQVNGSATFISNVIASGRPATANPSNWSGFCIDRNPSMANHVLSLIGNTLVTSAAPGATTRNRSGVYFNNDSAYQSQPLVYNNLFVSEGDIEEGDESAIIWAGPMSDSSEIRYNAFWGYRLDMDDYLYWDSYIPARVPLTNAQVLDPGLSFPDYRTNASSAVLAAGSDPADYWAALPAAALPFLGYDRSGALRSAPFACGAYE